MAQILRSLSCEPYESMNSTHHRAPALSKPSGWISVVIGVAALHLAREIFIPVVLAILCAFLLQPLAGRFEKLRFGRPGSAIAAVLIALLLGAALTELVALQLGDLGKKLPEYETNIHRKLKTIESKEGKLFGHAAKSIQHFRQDLIPTNAVPKFPGGTNVIPADVKPLPVEVRDPGTSLLQLIRNLVGPLVGVLTTLFLITVLCIFLLVARDDLRARLMRVAGSREVKLTSQWMDDVGHRLSRYLLMQLIVNTAFGIAIGLGLWFMGGSDPLLWGIISALFRYIPYAGPWLAASMPFAIGFAINPGWGKPFLVLGLFAAIEIIAANLIEPWLYGNSTGITPLAVLLAAIFWTWVWGPVGLLLAVPMTVCLVSIAKYVPQMELLEQLFAERDAKTRETSRPSGSLINSRA